MIFWVKIVEVTVEEKDQAGSQYILNKPNFCINNGKTFGILLPSPRYLPSLKLRIIDILLLLSEWNSEWYMYVHPRELLIFPLDKILFWE